MLNIRKGVFETNSSSSHSIVMMKKDAPVKTVGDSSMVDGGWRINKDGTMRLCAYELEFGRSPFELLTNWYDRLRYAVASYSEDDDGIEHLEEICRRRIAGFTGFRFDKERYDDEEPHDNRGYIDHQSWGLLNNALMKFDVDVEEFIFNDRYIVVIDGDEYCVFDTFQETDMFNPDSVEKIVPSVWEYEENYLKEHGDN